MKRLLSIGLSALLLSAPATASAGAAAEAGEPIPLRVTALKLNVERPAQTEVGRLLWRGGLELISEDDRLGGLSALWLSPDAERAVAVSDEGHWVTFAIGYDGEGTLATASNARLGPLREPDGRSLAGLKDWGDAEGIAVLPSGEVLVAFERHHRLNRYDALPPTGRPTQAPVPGNHAPGANAGVESLAVLPGGGLLAISEGLTASFRETETWLGFVTNDDIQPEWQSFHIPKDADLAPVDAQIDPGMRYLYWLERGFSIVGGVRVKLKRAPLATISAGTLLQPEELAFFKAPLTVDNIEGLWLREGPDGETLITLLSDDNFSRLQRTLLLQFELIE
ncbi:esterase-like activity of phytase family protein [Algihabitans albus]|uniref:esterase-like activity of phytase family protein n=1 Tax=Algihabitans albus TaxID=2164067 RepID=UPI0013C326E8|nr:esterase-like activity of phytase family protein [Algihabitans albus]